MDSQYKLQTLERIKFEHYVRFYYLDVAYDSRYPSCVVLIGKARIPDIKSWTSICILVKGLKRKVYVRPKKNVSFDAITDEIQSIKEELKIEKEMTLSKVKKRLLSGDEHSDRSEIELVKIEYPYDQPSFPDRLKATTFDSMFGHNDDIVSNFVIEKGLKGPCWLRVDNIQATKREVSWCKLEYYVEDPSSIKLNPTQYDIPPLILMSLKTVTLPGHKNQKSQIAAVSMSFHTYSFKTKPNMRNDRDDILLLRSLPHMHKHFLFTFKSDGKLFVEENEYALLSHVLAIITAYDPDIIVGHNIFRRDLFLLLNRLIEIDLVNWSVISRLKLEKSKILDLDHSIRRCTLGRLIADTEKLGREFFDTFEEFSFSYLVKKITLSKECPLEYNETDISNVFASKKKLQDLCTSLRKTTEINLLLLYKMNALELSLELTILGGNLWYKSLLGGKFERNDYFLMHQFHEQGYLPPNKVKNYRFERKGASYKGGLVLEPKRGFYNDYVICMDFKSLYPSLMIEHNICFTTVQRTYDEGVWTRADIPEEGGPRGILPSSIKNLIDRRAEILKQLKNEEDPLRIQQLKTRQQALKVVANSIYGSLGFKNARFYCVPLAELITRKGREALEYVVNMCRDRNFDVIYGDTDSVMINSKSASLESSKHIDKTTQEFVETKFNYLKINRDRLFKKLLLITKKKYSALACIDEEGTKTEIISRGVDLVRRDVCKLATDISLRILDILFEYNPKDIPNMLGKVLRECRKKVNKKHYSIEDYIIRKCLVKDISLYKKAHTIPHVKVAIDIMQRGEIVSPGQIIEYVICKSSSSEKILQSYKACSIKYLDQKEIDVEWYLLYQISPVLRRICSPIAFLSDDFIDVNLGLKSIELKQDIDIEVPPFADPLIIKCKICHNVNRIDDTLTFNPKQCNACSHEFSTEYVKNQIRLHIRSCVTSYYTPAFECLQCNKIAKCSLHFHLNRIICLSCFSPMKQIIPDKYLYEQIMFLKWLVGKFFLKEDGLEDVLNFELDRVEYRYINLSKLFGK